MDLIKWQLNPSKWFKKEENKPAGCVGIACSQAGIALCYGLPIETEGENEYHIEVCDFAQIPPEEQLAYAKNWVQENNLQKADCHYVLAENDYELQLLERPAVEDSELTEAVRWRLKDLISLPIEDVAVDIFSLPEDAYRGRVKMLYAVVVSKEIINDALSFVHKIGLNNKVVDIYEMSLRNIALYLPEMDFGTVALLRMQENQGSMLMFSHVSLYLTRQIELGYSSFASELGAFSLDNEVMIDRLALDVQRSLDYYESQLGKGVANKIYILPLEDENVHFKDDLENNMHTPILHFDCREFVSFAQDAGPNIHDQAYCLPAIGAVLRRVS